MSYLQRKSNYAYKVRKLLEKYNYDVSGIGSQENKIMIKFLREHNLPYVKWNYNYKGLNTANLINAETINNNWDLFKTWIKNKKNITVN